MKARKEKKSLLFLKMIVAVLFASLLFAHENSNRSLIAGIAIIGIIGSLLFLIVPMLPRIRMPQFTKRTHVTSSPKPERLSKTETLLWRQINYQITDKLKAAFPDATWEFITRPQMNTLLNGSAIRIRTRNTGNYNFAEFHLNQYGYLALELLTVESLKKQPVNESGEIFIRNGKTPEIKGTFEHFPSRSYWPALADIFIKDELEAKEREHEP